MCTVNAFDGAVEVTLCGVTRTLTSVTNKLLLNLIYSGSGCESVLINRIPLSYSFVLLITKSSYGVCCGWVGVGGVPLELLCPSACPSVRVLSGQYFLNRIQNYTFKE